MFVVIVSIDLVDCCSELLMVECWLLGVCVIYECECMLW